MVPVTAPDAGVAAIGSSLMASNPRDMISPGSAADRKAPPPRLRGHRGERLYLKLPNALPGVAPERGADLLQSPPLVEALADDGAEPLRQPGHQLPGQRFPPVGLDDLVGRWPGIPDAVEERGPVPVDGAIE